jgi:GDPmannose 4,6-dehydratase
VSKKALITGVTGQDGAYLTRLLLDKGYEVHGVKRRTSLINTDRVNEFFEHPNFQLHYGNLHDGTALNRLVFDIEPDEIYNLGAQSHVRVSFEVPVETVDAVGTGTLRLLEAVRLFRDVCGKDVRFYQASSSEMYGDNPEAPQNEETRMTPASPYACAKLFSHGLIRNYRLGYGIHASSGILFNHESPLRGETFVTRKITMAAANIRLGRQKVLELGNLDAKRDWGFAGDYVEAMWMMLQQDAPDDYVVATGETHTVREFLEKTFELAGLKVEDHVKINKRLFRPHEVPLLLGDSSKARERLGWAPKVTFEGLVEMMYQADFDAAVGL